MLKKSVSFVLASFSPSTYRKGTLRAFTRCGLAGRPFWASCRRVHLLSRTCQPTLFCLPKWFSRHVLTVCPFGVS